MGDGQAATAAKCTTRESLHVMVHHLEESDWMSVCDME